MPAELLPGKLLPGKLMTGKPERWGHKKGTEARRPGPLLCCWLLVTQSAAVAVTGAAVTGASTLMKRPVLPLLANTTLPSTSANRV
ncbi:hypothetical protein ACVWZX_001294 [Deinococcus sp. UYEF24]